MNPPISPDPAEVLTHVLILARARRVIYDLVDDLRAEGREAAAVRARAAAVPIEDALAALAAHGEEGEW